MSISYAERYHGWLRQIAFWREQARGRRTLARLDDAALKDLGISRVDAWQELRKPFWRARVAGIGDHAC